MTSVQYLQRECVDERSRFEPGDAQSEELRTLIPKYKIYYNIVQTCALLLETRCFEWTARKTLTHLLYYTKSPGLIIIRTYEYEILFGSLNYIFWYL